MILNRAPTITIDAPKQDAKCKYFLKPVTLGSLLIVV
jgi:hypothetical protein